MSDHKIKHRTSNVELVKQLYDAFKERDIPKIFSLFADDIKLTQSTELPWGGKYKGHEGAREFFTKLMQNINSTVVIERFIDAGDNVVVIGRTQGTVNATGVRYNVPITHVWTIEDDEVTRVRYYIDNPTMLEALDKKA